jgi:hypothetical protein
MESIEYKCKVCNKQYKTYQTLWKHNKKFHDQNTINNNHSTIINQPNIIINQSKNECNYCKKIFSHYNNKWRHEKKCKIKHDELAKIKEETRQTELLLALKKEESKILQLKLKLEKSNKVDNITLKKLNRMLIERNTRIKNINSNNTINNNQQIINNFQLIGFGKEEVMETLTKHEKKLIMNARYNSLDKLIEIIHCGKYSQFKNIIVTNMKDNYIYKYDDKVGHFVLSTKTDVLNSLIDYRLDDLETIYHDLLENNKLDENTKDIIEKFINKINYVDTKYTDYEGKEHENYKQYKINEIKVLLFNNQDKITNDISLLLTTNEVTSDLII